LRPCEKFKEDYINASYIDSPTPGNVIIAAQGPSLVVDPAHPMMEVNTIPDMWRMIG